MFIINWWTQFSAWRTSEAQMAQDENWRWSVLLFWFCPLLSQCSSDRCKLMTLDLPLDNVSFSLFRSIMIDQVCCVSGLVCGVSWWKQLTQTVSGGLNLFGTFLRIFVTDKWENPDRIKGCKCVLSAKMAKRQWWGLDISNFLPNKLC